MAKRKTCLEVAGWTDDGKRAYKGIFKQQDTYGLPLILIWKKLKDNGAVIAWDWYIDDALAHGWGKDKILSSVREISQFGYEREEGRRFYKMIETFMEWRLSDAGTVAVRSEAVAGDAGSVA